MANYYIKYGLSSEYNASSKAMKDIMHLLDVSGFKRVLSMPYTSPKYLKSLDIPILCFTVLFMVGHNDFLFYAVPCNYFLVNILKLLRRVKKFNLVCFIYDVNSLRYTDRVYLEEQEFNAMRVADYILAPNENSIKFMRNEKKITNALIPVHVWDYLIDNKIEGKINPDRDEIYAIYNSQSVGFAGNLSKAPFVEQLSKLSLTYKIWGKTDGQQSTEHLKYMGALPADELPEAMSKCTWGLVWDGDSIETCNGLMGTYLKFNNTHKCGLTLASNVPIIVWSQGGMSHIVNRYKCGIAVDSISQAEKIISTMSFEDYYQIRQNATMIGCKVRKGEFFLNALQSLIKK